MRKATMTEDQLKEEEHQSMFVVNSGVAAFKKGIGFKQKPTQIRHKSALTKSRVQKQKLNNPSESNSKKELEGSPNGPKDFASTLY